MCVCVHVCVRVKEENTTVLYIYYKQPWRALRQTDSHRSFCTLAESTSSEITSVWAFTRLFHHPPVWCDYIIPSTPPVAGRSASYIRNLHMYYNTLLACFTLWLWGQLTDDKMKNKQSTWYDFGGAIRSVMLVVCLHVVPVRELSDSRCSSSGGALSSGASCVSSGSFLMTHMFLFPSLNVTSCFSCCSCPCFTDISSSFPPSLPQVPCARTRVWWRAVRLLGEERQVNA